MSVQRSFVIVIASVCALAMGAYLFMHDAMTARAATSQPLSDANECSDPGSQTSAGPNSNAVQFVSCGGFLN